MRLKNPELGEGYICRIETGPGIFIGENSVRVVDQEIKVFAINSTTQDVELTIPFLELEEYVVMPSYKVRITTKNSD